MDHRLHKINIFAVLIVFLMVITFLAFMPSKKLDTKSIIKTHQKSYLVDDILINGDTAIYDKQKKIFYFSNFDLLKNFKLEVKSKHDIKYEVVGNKKKYIFVYSDKYYERIPIVITNNPIINIIYPEDPNTDYFNNDGNIEPMELYKIKIINYDVIVQMLSNNDKKANILKTEKATLNIRGTASALFHFKKSYKIEFSKKQNVFNILKDNAIVLDALSTDNSKIRNILSSDMWNLINDDQSINNDLVGDFVEVFINSHYVGLYVLKSKVNKGTLGIDSDGLLVKDIAKNNEEFIEALMDDRYLNNKLYKFNSSMYFINYQIKYSTQESFIDFVNKLRAFYQTRPNYEVIDSCFYMDNYIDYVLLVTLISGRDNIVYNKYYSKKNINSKILITPWDMDLTWGLDWAYDTKLHSTIAMKTSYDKQWLDEYLNGYTDKKIYKLLKKRYFYLRKNVITAKTINSIIDGYEKKIVDSGAYIRDRERWDNYDVEKELPFVRKWAKSRLKFLDEYFGR